MFRLIQRLFSRHQRAATVATPDKRTAKNLATLDPKARDTFLAIWRLGQAIASKHGNDYVMISGNRSYAEQDALYAKGRTQPGAKVTNARGGYSNHNFGIAADFGVFRAGKYLDADAPKTAEATHRAVYAAAVLEGLPVTWGGLWKTMPDFPHFEIKTGLTMAAKRERMAKHGSVLS